MSRPSPYRDTSPGTGGGVVEPGAWQHGPPRALRLWGPVVASALVQLIGAVWICRVAHVRPGLAVLTVGLAAVGPLALIAARRFPGPVVVVAAAAAAAELLVGVAGGPLPLAFAFALASAIVRGARAWAWGSLVGALAVAFIAGIVTSAEGWSPPRVIGTTFGMLLAIGLGELVRSRRDRRGAFRAELDRRRVSAAEEERLRIARELHDVLAHSLSQINVQAGVGLHLAERHPEQAVEALAAIKQVSRTALDDVRAVLGVLRADGDGAPLAPQPGIERIAELVRTTGIPGAEIVLERDDLDRPGRTPAIPAPVSAASYRIVQESLTNVARHGEAVTRVVVRLGLDGGALRIEVRDDGRVAPFTAGRGLTGMRERVERLGGDFEMARDGGFAIRARLPLGRRGEDA